LTDQNNKVKYYSIQTTFNLINA